MKKILLTLSFGLFVIPFGISQNLPSYIPTDGLVAYYPFNGNANDESGNGNNGTVIGATLTTDRGGNTNSAYNFEGVNCCGTSDSVQEIKITNNLLNLSENYTISCWMKSSSISKYQQILFSSYNVENGNGFAVELNNEHVPDKLSYAIGPAKSNTNWDVLYAEGDYNSFEINKWYNIVFVKEGIDYKLYLNGVVEGTTNLSLSNNYTQDVGLIIGSIGEGYQVFKGALDDYGVWNRALSEQEIQNIYTSSTGDILLNGTVSAENNQIKNLADPTDAQDAATKNYTYSKAEVDALVANLQNQIDETVYTIGHWPELGGYVFMISADGKHGLVAEIEDQGVETWYNAQNLISNPSSHSIDGQNFTDWRLPTRYELAQMYSLKSEIESAGGIHLEQKPIGRQINQSILLMDLKRKPHGDKISALAFNIPTILSD